MRGQAFGLLESCLKSSGLPNLPFFKIGGLCYRQPIF
jgi:hypothetical protein